MIPSSIRPSGRKEWDVMSAQAASKSLNDSLSGKKISLRLRVRPLPMTPAGAQFVVQAYEGIFKAHGKDYGMEVSCTMPISELDAVLKLRQDERPKLTGTVTQANLMASTRPYLHLRLADCTLK